MKYIDLKIFGLEKTVRIFENETKEGNQPDYTGFGVSAWCKESKKEEKKE